MKLVLTEQFINTSAEEDTNLLNNKLLHNLNPLKMTWNDTSDTCTAVYGSLIVTGQIANTVDMDDAKIIEMQNLQFYNNTASDAINNAKALALATALDSEFTGTCSGTYKTGYNQAKAIDAINKILIVKTDTVEDLSDAVDLIYVFP